MQIVRVKQAKYLKPFEQVVVSSEVVGHGSASEHICTATVSSAQTADETTRVDVGVRDAKMEAKIPADSLVLILGEWFG